MKPVKGKAIVLTERGTLQILKVCAAWTDTAETEVVNVDKLHLIELFVPAKLNADFCFRWEQLDSD